MPNDIMIDNETLSTRANAVILTCGAMKFDRYGDIRNLLPTYPESVEQIASVAQVYYQRINIDEAKSFGFHVDNDTVKWWINKSPEAKVEAFYPHARIGVDQFLNEFYMFAGGSLPWSHGGNFDVPMMENWFALRGIKCPWRYTSGRCTRTLFDITGIDAMKFRNKKRHHHALFDCWDQVLAVQAAFRVLMGKLEQVAA